MSAVVDETSAEICEVNEVVMVPREGGYARMCDVEAALELKDARISELEGVIDGLSAELAAIKASRAKNAKQYFDNNKEAVKKQKKEYYAKNKERIRQQQKAYYDEMKPAPTVADTLRIQYEP